MKNTEFIDNIHLQEMDSLVTHSSFFLPFPAFLTILDTGFTAKMVDE